VEGNLRQTKLALQLIKARKSPFLNQIASRGRRGNDGSLKKWSSSKANLLEIGELAMLLDQFRKSSERKGRESD
jgi:hypothetical protein